MHERFMKSHKTEQEQIKIHDAYKAKCMQFEQNLARRDNKNM